MTRCVLIGLALLLCAGTARAAEVTLGFDFAAWPSGAGNKLFLHVTNTTPVRAMLGFNLALHHTPGLVFGDGDGSVYPSEWTGQFAHVDSIVSIICYVTAPPMSSSATVALFFYNTTAVNFSLCTPGAFWVTQFQAGAGLGGFTTEVLPFPCAPTDVAPRPSTTWGAVKELFR